MKTNLLIFVLFAASVLVGCKSGDAPDCFKTAGDVSSETRTIEGFLRKVQINDEIDVTFIPAEENKVIVKGPEYLIADVVTSQEQGTLQIRNENTCNWVRDLSIRMEVEVYTTEVEYINYQGQGDVLFQDTLETDHLTFENNQGFGDVLIRFSGDSLTVLNHDYTNIKVIGEARIASFFHQGSGVFDASELQAVAVLTNNNSLNSLYVYPINYLFAKLTNKGNTYYKGSPENIDTDISGSGELLPY